MKLTNLTPFFLTNAGIVNLVPSGVLGVPAGFKASIEGDSLLFINDNGERYEINLRNNRVLDMIRSGEGRSGGARQRQRRRPNGPYARPWRHLGS